MKMTSISTPSIPAYAKKRGVRGAYTLSEVISTIKVLKAGGKSFRKIATEEYNGLITHAVIQRLCEGHEPHDPKIRAVLGMPAKVATVYVIGGGVIPPGAQVISANLCECGQPFISNHPARKRCFICSPYKRKAMKEHHAG